MSLILFNLCGQWLERIGDFGIRGTSISARDKKICRRSGIVGEEERDTARHVGWVTGYSKEDKHGK